MRMRKAKLLLATALLSLSMGVTAYAGTWQQQENGQWKYQSDNGNYATGWIDENGKSYYLDANGIMLVSAITPDDYYVGPDGACIRDESNNDESTYQGILDSYTAKLKAATPILLEEYKAEARNNTGGLNGLAEINTQKVGILAQINTNGISKMAEFMMNHGSGSFDEYMSWSDKLFDVYMKEGDILFDAYIKSAN